MIKHYKYRLEEDRKFTIHELATRTFSLQFVDCENGVLTIKKGYAWDGCSPKKVLHLGPFVAVIGTPDGPLRNGKAWTYDASLVHDVLCQYRNDILLTQYQVVRIFERMLTQVEWPAVDWYVAAVERFGPQDFYPYLSTMSNKQ